MKHQDVKPRKGYVAFVLDEHQREYLISHFPFKYPKEIAHHVTLKFGVSEDSIWLEKAQKASKFEVIGEADSGDGLQALAVKVDGHTLRPDGGKFHITWSLDPSKYKPVDSNKLIEEGDWEKVTPILFNAKAKFVPF